MRIISQDGTIDVPYEKVAIQRCGNRIYFLNKNLISIEQSITDMQIAHYSSSVKAEKAMEMLRTAYLSRMKLDGGYDMVHGCYVQPNYWVLPKVFQFPQDEDVDV